MYTATAVKTIDSAHLNHPLSSFPLYSNDKTVPVIFYNSPIKVISADYKALSADYYNSTLGFFCKKEIQMEKTLKFPLKFRLGSVAYTDKMEGKASAAPLPAYH